MKLLNATQLQQWDAYTIMHEPISSVDLMERAAMSCARWLIERGFHETPVTVFCGKGNNGGDGLAIARLLMEAGARVTVYIIEFGTKGTPDFQHNLERLHMLTADIHFIQSPAFFPVIEKNSVVIDALFGSGLNRPLHDLSAALVEHINAAGALVVSIDLPSGMPADNCFNKAPVIKAIHTLSFQITKLCFLLPEYEQYTGELKILDIGLDISFIDTLETVYEMADRKEVRNSLRTRTRFSHKGTYGHAMLIAGHRGQMGAAILASKACLRSGVGKLTNLVPEAELCIIQTAVPEAMARPREMGLPLLNHLSAVGIGPGMGMETGAKEMTAALFRSYQKPMVLDADTFTILSGDDKLLSMIPRDSLLTPHPKEFDIVFGSCSNSLERYRKAIMLSQQYSFIIILKGHYTLVAANGRGWFNTTGNAGMAKGGSGDALTGLLTGLLAQGYEPLKAAKLGVYLHGLAGDLALAGQTMETLLPTDLIETFAKAFQSLRTDS